MRREFTAFDRITERTLCVVDDEPDAGPRHCGSARVGVVLIERVADSTALPGDSVVTR